MEVSIGSRIKHAWNAFLNRDPTGFYRDIGVGYSYRPDRPRLTRGNERSIVTSVYNRIALDCASINIQHVRLDDSERFLEKISSGLNDCLNLSANIDQTGRAFLQDVVLSMLDEGCVAIIPVDTDDDPDTTGSYKIETMRTGKILEWFPNHIKARVYNERTGLKEDIVVPKDTVAIIENPLYAVMNEPNSTMQRLIRKLNLLDVVDEQSSSGKLDLIIQLPYVIKTEARRQQAEKRRVEIERQLAGSKYGIAYTDGTERITQLNRSVENNLMKQIEYLTSMLYSQLGMQYILERRIIWKQTILSGNFQNGIKKLLDENIINPSDASRKVEGLIFEASTDPAITGLTVDAQFTGDNLYDAIKKLCDSKNVGFRIKLSDDNKFVFKLYAGADRSYDQFTNPYVIFSPKFENVINTNYLESKKTLKTVTLVAGEGEGADRRTTTVACASGAGTGLNRRELYTDARDVSSTVDNETLTDTEYNAQLSQRGLENLAENIATKSFEGKVESTRMYRYGEDFFLGDMVQIVNEYGIEGKARVTEFIRSQSKEGLDSYPTFVTVE